MKNTEYRKIIEDTAFIYPDKNKQTYCNYYATNVMDSCGVPFPKQNGEYEKCENILYTLKKNQFYNWRSVNYIEAQKRANNGQPAIAITVDHVAVITPIHKIPNSISDVYISQSGKDCFFDKKITYGWTKKRLGEINFFAYLD